MRADAPRVCDIIFGSSAPITLADVAADVSWTSAAALSVVGGLAAGAAALAPRCLDEAVDLTVATLHVAP